MLCVKKPCFFSPQVSGGGAVQRTIHSFHLEASRKKQWLSVEYRCWVGRKNQSISFLIWPFFLSSHFLLFLQRLPPLLLHAFYFLFSTYFSLIFRFFVNNPPRTLVCSVNEQIVKYLQYSNVTGLTQGLYSLQLVTLLDDCSTFNLSRRRTYYSPKHSVCSGAR